jgi:hypothetical protein
MGYRSRGILAMSTALVTRSKLLQENWPRFLTKDYIEDIDIREEGGFTYYGFSEIKMYETYPDINEFYKFLDWLDEMTANYGEEGHYDGSSYVYVEIGEDDIVTNRGYSDTAGVYPQVEIITPWGTE